MNAVEIEAAVSRLAEAPFDPAEFPFAFLEAFGNKSTTLKRLRSGSSNQSDIGGVLQRNNIHLKVCAEGAVAATLTALRESPATARQKAKFILATDGNAFEAENLVDGETVACAYVDFADHFGFFLPLAGITTVRQIRENAFDIKATGRLNRLYIELLKENPDWDTAERREEMNHFMARLIFCFFAEDTNIFHTEGLFTHTVAQMSASDSSNTHEVLAEIFRAMSIPDQERQAAGIRNWARQFPYANGGLFSGRVEVPRFSRIARSYLLHVGNLDWTKINPDIFGSMIQAVADEEERGALGMHYTSVPNILKVLNPLFLDDLREQLAAAEDNPRKLLNLRKRMARIRVFDPACGSGNFLVIAYKEMRAIEAEINRRRGEPDLKTEIPLTNFRGIEIRHFSCEIARLALIIAEYQCNVLYRGQQEALLEFLPLKADNWITCGNALRLDWLSICQPTGTGVKVQREDLDIWGETQNEAEIDFENEGGETYICGNPPYVGDKFQNQDQKDDLGNLVVGRKNVKAVDYIAGWLWKASDYIELFGGAFGFVSTNSICQGVQVPLIWTPIFNKKQEIFYAHRSFYWSNNASKNANVICVIVGVRNITSCKKSLFDGDLRKETDNINAYLVDGPNVIVEKHANPINGLPEMVAGNIPRDQANFMLSSEEKDDLILGFPEAKKIIRSIQGSKEFINGLQRYCLWIEDEQADFAASIPEVSERLKRIRHYREIGSERGKLGIETPHRFERTITGKQNSIIVPHVSSEHREFLPVGLLPADIIISDAAQAIYDAPLYILAILTSKIHIVWTSLTAGRMKSDFRYSSGVCYNGFPLPLFTEQNKTDLTRCAEEILLAREHYFPATIADMYDPNRMDSEFPLVRHAHDRNDETLERIYIGRRFKNDTERLEKLFELYTKMTSQQTSSKKTTNRKPKGAK